jgi:hypothetical protein
MSTLDSNSRTSGSGANDDKESRVYRIMSLVFAARGVAAPITAKTLRRAIDGVKDQIEVATLLSCYSEAEVDRVAERLRSEGAFDCRDKARGRCPQPFSFVREMERQRGKAKKWRRRQARARSRERRKEYRASLAKLDAAVSCTPQAMEEIGSCQYCDKMPVAWLTLLQHIKRVSRNQLCYQHGHLRPYQHRSLRTYQRGHLRFHRHRYLLSRRHGYLQFAFPSMLN